MRVEEGNVFLLSKLRWDLCGTLTFCQEQLPERVRVSMFVAVMRAVAKRKRLYYPRVISALRQEIGQGGQYHFHFLLTGLPQRARTRAVCSFIAKTWERKGGGMARVALYNPALNGVGYVAKCSVQAVPGSESSAKFGENRDLMLSKSFWATLKAH